MHGDSNICLCQALAIRGVARKLRRILYDQGRSISSSIVIRASCSRHSFSQGFFNTGD
jgi:hypothetical protein